MNTATAKNAAPASGLSLSGRLSLTVNGKNWKMSSSPPWSCTAIPGRDHILAMPSDASGGMRGGDTFELDIVVQNGAYLVWQPPGASIFYPPSAGSPLNTPCAITTRIHVEAGCSLVFLARPSIPAKGSSIRQKTHIEVQEGANCVYQELWTSGRIASGESFLFGAIDSECSVFQHQKLLYREAWLIGSKDGIPRGPAGIANHLGWGFGLGFGVAGIESLEKQNDIMKSLGHEYITAQLNEQSHLTRIALNSPQDRAFSRFWA